MTDELLQRVREVDPLPDESAAPPFASVYARLTDAPRQRDRPEGSRLLGLLGPAVVVTASLGVLAVAVILVHAKSQSHHPSQTAGGHHSTNSAPAPIPAIPTGGMTGFVTVWGAAFNSGGDGIISLEQCLGCRPDGNQTSKSTDHDWLVTTTNGGRSWTLSSKIYSVSDPQLDGNDGWSAGSTLLTRQQAGHLAAYEPGVNEPHVYKTDDDGRSWRVASAFQPDAPLSLVAGEVWASSSDPAGSATILHSPVTGTQLTPTESQPIHSDSSNVRVVGAGDSTAYAINAGARGPALVTHDDGRSWQQITLPPCTGRPATATLDAGFGQTVYLTCAHAVDSTPQFFRSLNGGQTWQRLSLDWGAGTGGPRQLIAINAEDAWGLNSAGDLLRTTNAGSTWQTVWSASDIRVSPLSRPITKPVASPLPILSAQSPTSASIVTVINRGTTAGEAKLTNLVTYRTNNGGLTWQTQVVALTNHSGPLR